MAKPSYEELLRRVDQLEQEAAERKRMEDELVAERNKLHSVLEAMQVGVTIRDLDYTLLYQNAYSISMLGEHTGEKCYRAIGRVDHICDGCPVALALVDGKSHHARRSTRLPSGEESHWDNIANPVRNARGEVVACLEINTNVTERVRAEEERRKLESSVQHFQKLESLGMMAAGVAHDFNNLLMGVLTNAGLALATPALGAAARARLERIDQAARRAAELSRQMLAYSGKSTLELDRVDLDALVSDMVPLVRSTLPKAVDIQVERSEHACEIWGDPTQLRQVLLNLMLNAAEAMGADGGNVTVRTACQHVSREHLAGTYIDDNLPPGEYVQLEVTDTGAGISDAIVANIFDPFFSTKQHGRGLGLSVVLGIVRGHRGAVRVTTQQAGSTTFRLLLPRATAHAVAPPRPGATPKVGPPSSEPAAPCTILVVEDEVLVREVVTAALELGGYCVLTAKDGNAAVETFRAHAREIDCVLLDLTMPGMTGEMTLAALRAIRADVPVVLTSGYSEHDAAAQFSGHTVSGFLQKPYAPAALHDILHRALGRAPTA